jgi:hypothetical protein
VIEELDRIVLEVDLPEFGLTKGDLGTAVLVHKGGHAFEVEFVTLDGETVVVTTLRTSQVRPARGHEITRVRMLEIA